VVRVISRGDIERLVSMPGAIAAIRQAFVAADQGRAVIITATSSTEPLLEAGWLAPGTHITAVGSDMPHKQELDPQILAAADKYVPDCIEAAAASGELHHAIEAGALDVGSVYGEFAALASGRLPGRTGDDELTVADLTGLGIQDAAVAALAARLADEHGAGQDLPLGGW
jgi:ornithine cyclodeaminase/alanine dehydrogenase-like protein (mu-crystallin family)